MTVPSWTFLAFALAAAAIFNLSRARAWRRGVLLVANLLFLASFVERPAAILPYAGFLVAGFSLYHGVRVRGGRGAHSAAILLLLLAFFWLKQYTFLPEATFLKQPYLLVGLSYVFFRVMHLVIDARDEGAPAIGLVDYLNFTLNFTALVSGPIQRYEHYRETAEEAPLPLGLPELGEATLRVVTGLFKIMAVTVAIAAVQHALTPMVTAAPGTGTRAWTGMVLMAAFPVYLYFNFSGYTDAVIGLARLFRLRLPENFDRPFTSASFVEYWSRWHMSLSNWLKTYVYQPLVTAAMRRIRNPLVLPYAGAAALFVTFFLVGAWHGRTSNFLFFGVLNGGGVAVNQAWRIVLQQRMGRKPFAALQQRGWYRFVGRGLTFTWVAFTLLWFWSDWGQIGGFANAIGPIGLAAGLVGLVVAASLALGLLAGIEAAAFSTRTGGASILRSRYVLTAWVTVMALGILAVQSVSQSAAPDIVYKDF